MEIIIKGEPEEIAALALAAQERRGDAGKPDVKKLVAEINRSILESGKSVLLPKPGADE